MGSGGAARIFVRAADTVPLTARGVCVAVFAGWALQQHALAARDLVVGVMGLTAAALVVLASLLTALAGGRVRSVLRRPAPAHPPRQLEVGGWSPSGAQLPSLAGWPLLRVSWSWSRPSPVAVRRLRGSAEWIRAARRFDVERVRRRFVVEDVFGFSRVAWECETSESLRALPARGGLAQLSLTRAASRGDASADPRGRPEGDRLEIRPHRRGDPARHILWKTYARTRELHVRAPELASRHTRRSAVYLVSDPATDDEPAAALARVTVEADDWRSDGLFGADGTAHSTARRAEALAAIARSGAAQAPAAGLKRFLSESLRDDRTCWILLPAHSRVACEAVRASLGSRPGGVVAFALVWDGSQTASPTCSRWRGLLRRSHWRGLLRGRDDSEDAASIRRLAGRLAALGQVWIVERTTGRMHLAEAPRGPREAAA